MNTTELVVEIVAPSWLVSSGGRALHRYRSGHGFKSRMDILSTQKTALHLKKIKVSLEDHTNTTKQILQKIVGCLQFFNLLFCLSHPLLVLFTPRSLYLHAKQMQYSSVLVR